MDSGTFLIGIVLLASVVGYIIWPWFKARKAAAYGVSVDEPSFFAEGTSLKTEREQLISALRDLEFDYVVEKGTRADYESLRNYLLAQLADIAARQEADAAAAIDALLNQAKVRKPSADNCRHCGESLRPDANFCVYCGEAVVDQVCPDCGSAVGADDQFCIACGFNLEVSPTRVI